MATIVDPSSFVVLCAGPAGKDPVKKVSKILFPRYPGDIRTPHVATPRRAKWCVDMAKRCINDQKNRIESLQQQLRRARKKIRTLEDVVTKLQEDRLVNGDMKETLLVNKCSNCFPQ